MRTNALLFVQYTMPTQRERTTTNSVRTFNFNTQLMLTAEKPFWACARRKNAIFFYRFCKINLNYVCLTFAICSSYFCSMEIKLATTNKLQFWTKVFLFVRVSWYKCMYNIMMPEKYISMRHDHFFMYFLVYRTQYTHPYDRIHWMS